MEEKIGTAHTVRFSRMMSRPVIGLVLDGLTRDPDAGEADQQFIVPNDSLLIDALRKTLMVGAPIHDDRQADLFG
jgi:hypothetical protein